jgi:hypothetical protein
MTSLLSPETLLLILSAMTDNGVMPYDSDRRHMDIPELKLKNKRTRRSIGLLDALAALCINQPRKQVLAVSLSLTPEGSILCIASNDGVSPEVAPHLHGIFTRLKNIRSSLLQEGNDENNTPQPNKGPTTKSLEHELLCHIFTFSMSKFKQRLLKRKKCFQSDVAPIMHAYATKMKDSWTREEAEDYKKFENLFSLFDSCFKWADLPPATPHIAGYIALWVLGTAMEWRNMIEDKGDTSRLTCWEREIGQSSESSFPTELTPGS